MEWIAVSIGFFGVCVWSGLSNLAVSISEGMDNFKAEQINEDE